MHGLGHTRHWPEAQTRDVLRSTVMQSPYHFLSSKLGFPKFAPQNKRPLQCSGVNKVPQNKKFWKYTLSGLEDPIPPALVRLWEDPSALKSFCLKLLPHTFWGRWCYHRVPKCSPAGTRKQASTRSVSRIPAGRCGPAHLGCPIVWSEKIKPLGQKSIAQANQIHPLTQLGLLTLITPCSSVGSSQGWVRGTTAGGGYCRLGKFLGGSWSKTSRRWQWWDQR